MCKIKIKHHLKAEARGNFLIVYRMKALNEWIRMKIPSPSLSLSLSFCCTNIFSSVLNFHIVKYSLHI